MVQIKRITVVGAPAVVVFGIILGGSLIGTAAAQSGDTSKGDQALENIVAPVVGQKACFSRTFDRAHLREHPKQKVTAMMFELRYVKFIAQDIQRYIFGMSVNMRGRFDTLYTSGYCNPDEDAAYTAGNFCAVDCDGGGVSIERVTNADALYVYVQTPSGGIAMETECGEERGGEIGAGGMRLEPGTDDKLFRLNKVSPAMCQPMEQKVHLGAGSR